MSTGTSRRRRPFVVVVAGGGVAALEACLALRHLAEERVSIELVAPEPRFWYRPLAVVEPFDVAHVHGIDLVEVAQECGARFTLGAISAVDAGRRKARTAAGAEFGYDALLLATGAKPVPAVPGALTFRGPADIEAFRALLGELESGSVRRVVFAVPGGVTWPLPLYELALQTATFAARALRGDVELELVTPEDAPLDVFGARASASVDEVLRQRGVLVRAGSYPVAFENGALVVTPSDTIAADRVVALPKLAGAPIDGVPRDGNDFVPTDANGRVRGVDGIFAAGDATTFPVKQGGIAAQQADAAAEAIAALAGAELQPQPFRPVLRGLVVTGGAPAFLRHELPGGGGETSVAEVEALWWPPGKIVGRYLAPFLAERAGLVLRAPAHGVAVSVDV